MKSFVKNEAPSIVFIAILFLLSGIYYQLLKIDTLSQKNIIVNITNVVQEPTIKKDRECTLNKNCKILAETIFFESRGVIDDSGKYAVGFVVMNRVDTPDKWPDDIKKVVYQKNRDNVCQFSFACDPRFDTEKERINVILEEQKSWFKVTEVAYDIYFNQVEDFTNGADHFYNPDKVSYTPKFAKEYKFVGTFGGQDFYRSYF